MVKAETPPPQPDKTLIASTMATDDKAQAGDLLLRIANDPSIPAATVATPLGTLSILPPELRDEIYRLLCSDTYYRISKRKWNISRSHRPWSVRHHSDLNMTGSSKSIRQEYLAVLHAEAVFSIQESDNLGWKRLTRDEIPFVDQVQKVEVIDYPDDGVQYDWLCYREGDDIREENEQLFRKGAEPFSLFIETGIPRKICIIRLVIEMPKAILIIHSPFFDAIRRLTDFKTLTLEIDSFLRDPHRHDFWSSDSELSYDELTAYIGGDSSHMDHAGAVKVIAESMKGALEPSLGPSTMSEERLEKVIHWEIKFHPRDYSAKTTNSGTGANQVVKAKEEFPGINNG